VIIPLTKIGLAFGSGSGSGGMPGQKGMGAGAGGGAGIQPVSVIVAFKDVKGPEGVQILSVHGMGPVSKLVADLGHGVRTMVEKEGGPGMMMKKGKKMMGKKGEGGEEEFKEPGTM
jgi:uncharacterized spore protein YtfJ